MSFSKSAGTGSISVSLYCAIENTTKSISTFVTPYNVMSFVNVIYPFDGVYPTCPNKSLSNLSVANKAYYPRINGMKSICGTSAPNDAAVCTLKMPMFLGSEIGITGSFAVATPRETVMATSVYVAMDKPSGTLSPDGKFVLNCCVCNDSYSYAKYLPSRFT